MAVSRLAPPASWQDPDTHFLKILESEWYQVLVTLQDCFTRATVGFWADRGVRAGHLPVTTGSISSPMGLGSDSHPVSVDMFGQRTYLADSMQFGLEYLCRLNEKGAYYLMPSFRGESSDATHLCQFFHSEAEVPGNLDDVIVLVEDYVRHLAGRFRAECSDEVALAAGSLSHLDRLADPRPFHRITFDEAVEMLGSDTQFVSTDADLGWRTLTRAGERRVMDLTGEFTWVTHFDELSVPFYQATDGAGRALNADLLFGPGEVVGSGERHVDGSATAAALERHNVSPAEYGWYLSMKDVAPRATSGFGLGVERFMMWLTQHDDIRDFQILVRENGRTIHP